MVDVPWKRFDEDKLRILRAVRFGARLGYIIDPATWAAMLDMASTIHQVSKERIRGELERILTEGNPARGVRMLDESEFLSPYGIRAMSKFHEENPFRVELKNTTLSAHYIPAEGDSSMFGGNSNWRGPIWMPMNYLILESLRRFYQYYGDDFKVEFPTHSGNLLTLNDIFIKLAERMNHIFLRDENGRRAVFGEPEKLQTDPHFKDYILFYFEQQDF